MNGFTLRRGSYCWPEAFSLSFSSSSSISQRCCYTENVLKSSSGHTIILYKIPTKETIMVPVITYCWNINLTHKNHQWQKGKNFLGCWGYPSKALTFHWQPCCIFICVFHNSFKAIIQKNSEKRLNLGVNLLGGTSLSL